MRAVEPEPTMKKTEEEDSQLLEMTESGSLNTKNTTSANIAKKVDPPQATPYRYAMPTHAVYSPPPIKVKDFRFFLFFFDDNCRLFLK